MTLPGKLSIGFLQEDNPQKYYFRIRPLVIMDEDTNTIVENVLKDYADDGFIRIVPDKNEISHFKSRMRGLGRYCMVDLRKHPNDNDKIRPNKNYAGETGDRNAYIIYSDVICKASALTIAEVIEIDPDADVAGLSLSRPGSTYVMLRRGDRLEGPYEWEEEGEDRAQLLPGGELKPIFINLESAAEHLVQVDSGDGLPVQLLIHLDQFGICEPATPADMPRPAPQPLPPEPQPAPEPEEPEKTEKPESPAVPMPETAPAPTPRLPVPEPQPAEKPWLHAASFASTRIISARLNVRQQAIQAQCGINPVRGRTIQDVVDEQWRQSRYDQLGHPVPQDITSRPVMSPVERAALALREAWALPDVRCRLVAELKSIDELREAMADEPKPASEASRRAEASMDQLEADRFKLLTEIDDLKKQRQETRNQLIEELKKTGNRQIQKLEQRIDQLSEELRQGEQAAACARNAVQAAHDSADRVFDEQLDQRIADLLAQGRARDMLYALSYGCPAPVKPPELYHPTAGELISDVRVRFEAAGLSLSNDEAVNLLACLTLNGITLVSGPTGSGKSDTVRALAAALGLSGTGRFVEMTAGEDWQHLGRQISGPSENGMPLTHLPEARRLFRTCDRLTPTLLLIDDANRAPIERYLDELMGLNEPGSPRQLTTGCEPLPIHPQLRLMMTVTDAPNGCPLTAKLLDRAFTIRLCPPGADLTWPAEPIQMPSVDCTVSLEALARAFDPNRELPGEIAHRLDELRRQLAVLGVKLSRRALVDMHRYLSAVLPMMQSDSMAALDLAIAQRALPAILASADLRALHELPDLMADLPHCLNLMRQPLALPPV